MQMWTSNQMRSEFLAFFEKNKHKTVASSSLTNSGDPTVLLTTAGMQQFKPYYLDPKKTDDELGTRRVTSSQKCFRTTDIDEVGDETHNTFFEMLGNFSFGDYFKKEAIEYAHEFITNVAKLPISYVTVFQGSGVVPKDEESRKIWNKLGVEDVREEGMEDVFWGPTGSEGPCGPTTEIYCKNAAGRDVEIWNIVFNEYRSSSSRDDLLAGNATLEELETKGIDTGMGLERLVMVAQQKSTLFETDLFEMLMVHLDGYTLKDLPKPLKIKSKRIISDHLRGATFLMAEGLEPSNVKAGYVLRRILRRAIRYAYQLELPYQVFLDLFRLTARMYADVYPELGANLARVHVGFEKEYRLFGKAIKKGTAMFESLAVANSGNMLKGIDVFNLYATFGFPYELIEEMAKERGLSVDNKGFSEALEKHKTVSKGERGQN